MRINRKPHAIGVGVILAVVVTIAVDMCGPQLAGDFIIRDAQSWKFKLEQSGP
jgi:hypothetical protein